MLQVGWFVGSILSVRRNVLACIVRTDGFIMAFVYITNFDHIRYPLPSLAIFLFPAVLLYFRVLYFIFMFCDPTDLIGLLAQAGVWGYSLRRGQLSGATSTEEVRSHRFPAAPQGRAGSRELPPPPSALDYLIFFFC